MIHHSSVLADALTALGLLSPEQLEEVAQLATTIPKAGPLAAELVRHGWLTNYQAEELIRRHGDGLVVGQYVKVERLGKGGMGEVFRAHDRGRDREVALKQILPQLLESPEKIERFLREGRAAARLSHDNIVTVHELDRDGETVYLVMELLRGMNLAAYVTKGRHGGLPVAEACDYVKQAALGLQHVHEKGMVHRDIKPDNLFRTNNGRIKILDLGLALITSATTLTVDSQMILGTPGFLAPEQVRDTHNVDIRADIYSLGCTLYHLLTGQAPYARALRGAVYHLCQTVDPLPVEGFRADIPPALLAVLRRMMARNPEDRFNEPHEVAQAIEPFTRVVRAPRPGETAEVRRPAVPAVPRGSAVGPGELVNSIGMRFVLIPAGTFTMGSPNHEEARKRDEGQHQVTLTKGFYLSIVPVTQTQWQAVMNSNPSNVKGADRPVEQVSWDDAVAFCRKVKELTGHECRLPTEAEWEYACRAGTTTAYSFGDRTKGCGVLGIGAQDLLGAHAWYNENSGGQTHPVGRKKPNAWGLYDMHGNVWEWCLDWYDESYCGNLPRNDPLGAFEGLSRVIRGGGWSGPGADCRSARRNRLKPDRGDPNIGFRVALVPATQ
jgi:formylglycine-generating enzyme required for sulfatase activity